MTALRPLPMSALALALAALATAGARDARAQSPRPSASALATARVVALPPAAVATAARTTGLAPAAPGSASVELTFTLAVERARAYEVTVRPIARGALRLLAGVSGGPLREVDATAPVAAGGGAATTGTERLALRVRLEGPAPELLAALPAKLVVDVVTRAADAERVHHLTAELRAPPALAAPVPAVRRTVGARTVGTRAAAPPATPRPARGAARAGRARR